MSKLASEREVSTLIAKHRKSTPSFDIVQFRTISGRSREEGAHKVATFGEPGATWWLEAPSPRGKPK